MSKIEKIEKVKKGIQKLKEEKEKLENEIRNEESLIAQIRNGPFYIDDMGVYRKGSKEKVRANNRANYDTVLSNSMEKDIFNKLKSCYCRIQKRHNDRKRKGGFYNL